MSAPWLPSEQLTLPVFGSAISSRELVGGQKPCDSLAGPVLNPCGQLPSPASPSALPEAAKGLPTTGTCGQSSPSLSVPVSLQSYLANRLQARLDVNGSPEYRLTWKQWPIQSQEPICALRASARPTSDNDFIGLLAGWPTPETTNGGDGMSYERLRAMLIERRRLVKERGHKNGSGRSPNLAMVAAAALTGYPTPSSRDAKGGYQGGRIRNGKLSTDTLDVVAQLALGMSLNSYPSKTVKSGGLNPQLTRWLMGFPRAWLSSKVLETLSARPSRHSSSAPQGKPSLTMPAVAEGLPA